MYWALFELATCEDPFMYKETLSYEAVNIMPSSDPSDFVPLSELVVKEIKDGDKQDNAITIGDQRIYLSNTLKKYVQSIIMGLRDEVYYSICDLSVEQLRKLDETYLMYEDNYWYRFMNVVDIYDIQQKFTDEYLQIIANDSINGGQLDDDTAAEATNCCPPQPF